MGGQPPKSTTCWKPITKLLWLTSWPCPAKSLLTFTAVDRGIEGMCLDSEGNIVACAGWKKGGAGPLLYVIDPQGTISGKYNGPACKVIYVWRKQSYAFSQTELRKSGPFGAV